MKYQNMQLNIILITILMLICCYLPAVVDTSAEEVILNDGLNGNASTRAQQNRADYDFSIIFLEESISLFPEKSIIDAKLENLGTKQDTYVVEIKQVPSNWTITFDNDEMIREYTLPSDTEPSKKFQDIYLIVTPPKEGEAYITLEAKSKSTGNVQKTGITLTVKQPIIEMELDFKEKIVTAQETVTFILNLTNLQEQKEQVTLELTGSGITISDTGKLYEWTYKLNISRSFELSPNGSASISIEIRPPTETVSGDKGIFNVEVTPQSDDEFPVNEIITVIVQELDRVEAEYLPTRGYGEPGDELAFTATLHNRGTGDLTDVKLFKGTLPPGWEFIYDESSMEIKYKEDKEAEVRVSIPDFAKVGLYNLPMGIWAKDKEVGNFTIEVEVLQVFGVDLENSGRIANPASGELRYKVDWKKDSDMELILRNTGNGADGIRLNLTGVPANWNVYFKSISPAEGSEFMNVSADFGKPLDLTDLVSENKKILAQPGSMVNTIRLILDPDVDVKITLGANTSVTGEQLYNFSVNAYTTNVSIMKSLPMEIMLIRSNLEIIDVIPSELAPRQDEKVIISVSIKNNFHVSAKNISVILKISDKTIGDKQIPEIQVNGTSTVQFEWTPTKKGLYTIDVELDGEQILLGNEPVYLRNLTVEKKSAVVDEEDGFPKDLFLVIGVIVVFTALAAVMLYISREKIRRLREKRTEELKKKNSESKNGSPPSHTPPAKLEGKERDKSALGTKRDAARRKEITSGAKRQSPPKLPPGKGK